MKLADSWVSIRDRLADTGVVDSSLEAEILHRSVLDMDRVAFISELQTEITPVQVKCIDQLINRRLKGEPLSYITGAREFYGLELVVDSRVLVPRQETELLVDLTLNAVEEIGLSRPVIIDVGTGSGAIAIALASRLRSATVYAVDLSMNALDVAKQNCDRHAVMDKVQLIHGDLFSSLVEMVDIVVCNPPYIPSGELRKLPRDIHYEPRLALDGGQDGLDVLRRLLVQAKNHIRCDGRLIFELSPDQVETAMELAQDTFPQRKISFERDLLNHPRAVVVH